MQVIMSIAGVFIDLIAINKIANETQKTPQIRIFEALLLT